MRLCVFQHVPFEGPARIADWARSRGHAVEVSRVDEDQLPAGDAFDALAVMGGPMSVKDERELPWLVAEKRAVHEAIDAGKPVLGVCLGAQMIAEVMGGRVRRNTHREIGFFTVERTEASAGSPLFAPLPSRFTALHWHGETFDLPTGAVHLGRSAGCENQAFSIGSALGLQFHIESTLESVGLLLKHCGGEINGGPFQQRPAALQRGAADACAAMRPLLDGLLDRWIG